MEEYDGEKEGKIERGGEEGIRRVIKRGREWG